MPSPVQITDHIGDTSAGELLSEVLTLTKMNWNSARFAERLPVTVRFASEVGAILRDLPKTSSPRRGTPSICERNGSSRKSTHSDLAYLVP